MTSIRDNADVADGNGMRPDVWEKFRERFGVRTISEFFASTEGNLSLFNVKYAWPLDARADLAAPDRSAPARSARAASSTSSSDATRRPSSASTS